MNIDAWQMVGSMAALVFTLGFLDQLRITFKKRNVEGLSLLQWVIFSVASTVFASYYAHLDQWLMFSISVFGTISCLLMLGLIFKYRQQVLE